MGLRKKLTKKLSLKFINKNNSNEDRRIYAEDHEQQSREAGFVQYFHHDGNGKRQPSTYEPIGRGCLRTSPEEILHPALSKSRAEEDEDSGSFHTCVSSISSLESELGVHGGESWLRATGGTELDPRWEQISKTDSWTHLSRTSRVKPSSYNKYLPLSERHKSEILTTQSATVWEDYLDCMLLFDATLRANKDGSTKFKSTGTGRDSTRLSRSESHLERSLTRRPSPMIERSILRIKEERFSYDKNTKYLQVASMNKVYNVTLYAKLPSTIDNYICSMKTEFMLAILSAFFDAWDDGAIHWVTDLQPFVYRLMTHEGFVLKNWSTTDADVYDCKAALVLKSKEAGLLVRHENLALLKTLSGVLQITQDELLVLCK